MFMRRILYSIWIAWTLPWICFSKGNIDIYSTGTWGDPPDHLYMALVGSFALLWGVPCGLGAIGASVHVWRRSGPGPRRQIVAWFALLALLFAYDSSGKTSLEQRLFIAYADLALQACLVLLPAAFFIATFFTSSARGPLARSPAPPLR
jgi:hypothetical protein